tara:strand:- start:782 stop:1723 length:942 start_codon:yes stop_codon:yes gene_type:complete
MRNHFLRASGSENAASTGGSGSFERGFFGGSSTSKLYPVLTSTSYNTSQKYLGVSHTSDPTITEDITWTLQAGNFQTFFNSYYRAHKKQDVILAAELTAASVPSGAKFNKLSQYIWGTVAPTGKIPRGVRWSMYHRNPSDTTRAYDILSGETATVLYQDNTTTEFPPLVSISGSSNMSFASGSIGELIEISAGGGNDTGITPSSYFTWNGTNDIIIEIATTQTSSSYQSDSAKTFVKYRDFLCGGMYRSDSDSTAYDNNASSTSTTQYPYVKQTSGSSDYSNWTNFSNWTINTGTSGWADDKHIQALKLDYTT